MQELLIALRRGVIFFPAFPLSLLFPTEALMPIFLTVTVPWQIPCLFTNSLIN